MVILAAQEMADNLKSRSKIAQAETFLEKELDSFSTEKRISESMCAALDLLIAEEKAQAN